MESNELFEEQDENAVSWWEMDYDDDVTTYIYDKKTRELVTKKVGIVPDPHEIGLEFGPGDYRAMIRGKNATGGKTVTKDFKLGKSYERKPEAQNKTVSGFAVPGGGGDIASQVAFGMSQGLKSIVSEFAPVLPALFEALKPKEPSYGAAMEQMYGSMNRILETNTKKQMDNFSEFQRQIMQSVAENMNLSRVEYEEEEEEEQESAMSILFTMVKPLLAGAMPGIMSGQGADIISSIKTNPLFVQVTSNAAVMKEIENWVLNEWGFDALKVLKELL